jgi:hypothetical protein
MSRTGRDRGLARIGFLVLRKPVVPQSCKTGFPVQRRCLSSDRMHRFSGDSADSVAHDRIHPEPFAQTICGPNAVDRNRLAPYESSKIRRQGFQASSEGLTLSVIHQRGGLCGTNPAIPRG